MFTPLTSYLDSDALKKLESAHVGIAGAGGLGSNCAVMLARSGVGRITVVDGDAVEERNLNRQHYLPKHIGMKKVDALAAQLRELAPEIIIGSACQWITAENIAGILEKAELWIEAMDKAQAKAMFAAAALKAGKTVISGSGMAGFGSHLMKRRIMLPSTGGMLAAVGDFVSDIADRPPLAPRVMQCAAMQADAALEWILTGTIKELH